MCFVTYNFCLSIVTIGAGLTCLFLLKYFSYSHNTIKTLIAFIFKVKDKHYKKVATKALYAEMYNEALETGESFTDNANDFEKDMYQTLKKVDKKI